MWKVVVLLVFAGHSSADFTQEAKSATNQFSLEFLKAVLQNETGNAVVSPVSVYTLLAILQQGAGGNTLQEVNNVLHAEPSVTKPAYKTLTTRYNGTISRTELKFATRAFADSTFQLKPDFREILANDFLSGIDSVDFNNSQNASAHINSWVSRATNHLIPQLFTPSDIAPPTALVLVNALYFMNYWSKPFRRAQNKAFSPSDGVEVQVPTLNQVQYYHAGHCSCIGVKYVHINFVDTYEFTVLLVLPTERHGLDNLLNQMTPQNLTNMLSYTGEKKVTLQLPKFRLRSDTNLRQILQALGINEAFSENANLGGITDQRIGLSKVIQKAEIAADEDGVTAAAATGATYFFASGRIYPQVEEMDFIADHPFLFFIVDRTNHVPLFAGRVTNPSLE